MELIKRAKDAYIAVSVLMLLIGSCLIIWPKTSLAVFCTVAGIAMVVFGVVKLFGYFSKDLYRLAFQFDLALGILSVLFGLVIAIHPYNLIACVPVIMGIFVMLDGVFKIQTALDARQFGLKAWWMVMLLAVVSGGFGLLLVLNPFEGAAAMMILLGVTIVADGIQNLLVVLYTVQTTRRRKRNEYD
ncbi:MAG: HdeD family acid-resistance protein [Lachnospiraceae bacterium]|uniref:HdeD family acid-resistance protein n=1 Tax=Parablautia sp. Marseille-Q6255 TaxID=3039593 RepID=UPI0024BC5F81|nr:DUF308 domain-containing protein [Parablautia sp. Marseille-Q6255]